jgi:hypothetical protein
MINEIGIVEKTKIYVFKNCARSVFLAFVPEGRKKLDDPAL